MIGIWIDAGVVPAMVYYGLKILSPNIFLIAVVLICSITSLATGTSWGTMGTMGVAMLGIAAGLGVPAPVTAGAILCGAYFGDKMSPLSDTTNLAPAMAGTDVMSHVKFMLLPTAITYGICLVFFGGYGFLFHAGGSADMTEVQVISEGLANSFNLNPLLLLPPVVVIVAVAMKMPAIPGITLGAIVGGVFGLIFQGGDCTLGTLLLVGRDGFVSETGVEAIDSLLTSGGFDEYDVLHFLDHPGNDVWRHYGGNPPVRGHCQSAHEADKEPGGTGYIDRGNLCVVQCDHARAVYFHCGTWSYVCRGVSKDGAASSYPIKCFGGCRHGHFCFDPLEYLWCVYQRHIGIRSCPVWSVGNF